MLLPQQLIENKALTDFSMDVVVVPHEWIKSAELHPTNAKFFVRVTEKAAYVGADIRNSE